MMQNYFSNFRWLLLAAIPVLALAGAVFLKPAAANTTLSPSENGPSTLYLPVLFGPERKVYIPAGTFFRGCDAANNGGYFCGGQELPLRSIHLDAFYIDRNEVTNAQYETCVESGACTEPTDTASATRPNYYGNPFFADYPVVYVDWFQAEAYCQWAGGRLPTEAEWEKAARGGSDTRPFPWGSALPTCTELNARIDETRCVGDTVQIGSYTPAGDSPYGVQDMEGNVYEYVNDWYSTTYYGSSPASNPQGPATGSIKVRRGSAFGSWGNTLRLVARIPTDPTESFSYVGIRCAYSP